MSMLGTLPFYKKATLYSGLWLDYIKLVREESLVQMRELALLAFESPNHTCQLETTFSGASNIWGLCAVSANTVVTNNVVSLLENVSLRRASCRDNLYWSC